MRSVLYTTSLSLGSLDKVDGNARLVREDPRVEVAKLKQQPGKYLSIGGVALASYLATAGLIDEYRFRYVPTLLGGGKAAFAGLGVRVRLQPFETRTFSSGTVLIRCRLASG